MATRLAWLGVILATLSGLSVQAQELLPQPAAKPMPRDSHAGIEAVADLIRASDHLEAAGAADLACQVRQQAKLLLKKESDRLAEAQARLLQLYASLPESQFRIPVVIAEVRETTADNLNCAIQSVAGEDTVWHEKDGCVWTVGRDCSSELIQQLSGEDKSRVSILSRPLIISLDGQAAEIQHGQAFTVVSGVTLVDGQAAQALEREKFGIEVSMKPQLIDAENATFEVSLEQSTPRSEEVPIFTEAVTGKTILSPVMGISSIHTKVALKTGGTMVVAIPSVGGTSSVKEWRSLLLLIATPRLVERD